jgi:hypothetical protein
LGELESWRAGELESWRAGELESWRAGELEVCGVCGAGEGAALVLGFSITGTLLVETLRQSGCEAMRQHTID